VLLANAEGEEEEKEERRGGESPTERVDYEDARNFTPLFTAENKAKNDAENNAKNNADITRQIKQAQAIKREQAPKQEERKAAI
jgi:hypothetical protein